MDLTGGDQRAAGEAIAALERDVTFRGAYGVRVLPGFASLSLPPRVEYVVLEAGEPTAPWRERKLVVAVTSLEEARAALDAGAHALWVRGGESGGRVGEETAFVLLQRLRQALPAGARLWLGGGIGAHTAAAAIAGGADAVWLDTQLALLAESSLPEATRRVLAAVDGSETVVEGGVRTLVRPGTPPLACGMDAALARPLADRFRTAGALVAGLLRGIDEHLRAAKALSPLAPGAPLAAAHGLRFPIAQGPMTRVSDRAAFAEAVSKGGGLPFLALSLMRGAEARSLLEETKARCDAAGLTWGVGLLGFAPPELRAEQLEMVAAVRPPVALIAGGRPAQAKPLEAQGTAVYLHVPSPGLLDLFLSEGARRFVLEGRECGGHVGPRSSFVLWETAIERLLAHPAVGECSVLFAGGIHDARSAAMVAACAAPLAARGCKVGVLAGTAYLFTEEAVATGAILPGFQAEAIACGHTVLLDTAPGHSTRAADTDFVKAFVAERDRLAAAGVSGRELWAALENLNLGRLRVAAKGLVREGDALRAVEEPEQKREGMYMIGQVAALRDRVVTVEALHRDISEGGAELVRAFEVREAPAAAPARPRPPRVAIVGMACIFPGAPDLDTFWKNVVTGQDAVSEVPKDRWNAEIYYDPKGTGEKTPSKWGGFLDPVPFDPAAYGIPPRSLAAIEPVQLLALEVSRRALADAGYDTRPFDRERASVIFGAEAGTDLSAQLGFRAQHAQLYGELPAELDKSLPRLTEDSFPGVLANVIAGRIANRLDLGGVNYTVDAACASSLAAVDLACKELGTGETDVVVCGGADLHNGIVDYLMFASVHALSPTGRCRTFDASADGIALGEGVAAVVLKRLDDAERDGDRIYAVIEGVGGSSDGKSLGLTAPRKEGQMKALRRAWDRAGLSPGEAELVEAHGTGTVVGDRTELATLTEVFGAAGAARGQITIGSVKSNIGHTKCAAGLAGLIKTALAIHHRVLPPTLHVKTPNPGWSAESSPFSFRDRAQPWASERRRAGVSAFGFGGTNFHAVLAEHAGSPAPETGLPDWPCELFLLRGATRAEAQRTAERLAALASSGQPYRLRDLAAGAAATAARAPVQLAFVATSLADLTEKARAAAAGRSARGVFVAEQPTAEPPKVAMLLPGQGSQRPGMLDELFVAFPQLANLLALGRRYVPTMFPGAALTPEARAAQKAAITDTRVAQPTLGIADLAVARLLESLGLRASALGGHSYGELVALCLAGVYDEAALLALSAARAESILAAAGDAPGTMAAVKASAEKVEAALAGRMDGIVLANLNAPEQTVIAGSDAAVTAAVAHLAEAGLSATRIPVACAFHSPIVAGGAQLFADRMAPVPMMPPDRPVYANTTAAPYPAEVPALRDLLAHQLARPVRWAAQIEAMYAAGVRVFVEAGPGRVLTELTRKILGDRPHLAIATDAPGESSLAALLGAVAQLATAGVPLAVDPLFAGRGVRALDLANPPKVAPPPTAWLVDGQMARPIKGELPEFAMRPLREPVRLPAAASAAPTGGPLSQREATVLEYLKGMRELVAHQKQVMLQYLGAQAGGIVDVVAETVAPAAAPRSTAVAAAPVAAAAIAPVATRSPLETLVGIVAERTGYPADMLDPDLDLEADLGIDSIKRIEILGTLAQVLGLSGGDGERSELVEKLATVKTLRALAGELGKVVPAAATAAPAAAPTPAPLPETTLSASSPLEILVGIVAERTGYPTDMLDPDLDLEADLGIDSIKRIEILGTLAGKLGLGERGEAARSELVEKLATVKTLRALGEALAAQVLGPVARAIGDNPALNGPARHALPESRPALRRYVLRPEALPPALPNGFVIDGRRFVVTDDGHGVAAALAGLLGLRGARVEVVREVPAALGAVDGVIHLAPLAATSPGDQRKALFDLARAAVAGGAQWLLAATGQAGTPGARPAHGGVSGLLKSVAKEHPTLRVRAVDLDPAGTADALAELLLAELLADDPHVQVAYKAGARHTLRVVAMESPAASGATLLGKDDVVLVTGGARGITALVAMSLARRYGCVIELVGRSPLPGDEDPALASCKDAPSLRRVLAGREKAPPAKIEAAVQRILADREIRATLAALELAGARPRYHAADVRDPAALAAVLDDVYARHGRLDGVIHGAGIIEDKKLADKTRESFDRVFDTKVIGALTLAEKLRDPLRFLVFFSSVSGTFGNRGQTDYAAANEALDHLAHHLAATRKTRVLSVAWGPWGGTGMISPELEREYARRGVGLIPPDEGVERLLAELTSGQETHVVLMNADAASLSG